MGWGNQCYFTFILSKNNEDDSNFFIWCKEVFYLIMNASVGSGPEIISFEVKNYIYIESRVKNMIFTC